MLWNLDIDVQIQSFTKWHISVIMKGMQNDKEWLITGFYGHLEATKREISQSLLKIMNPSNNLSWFCFGDFNVITC